MATILLVEDVPDLGTYEARLLQEAGHRVIRCGGSPAVLGPCPLVKGDDCPLPDVADVIVFSCGLFAMRGRTYSGRRLLQAYREHPRYGRLPMLIVSVAPEGTLDDLPGSGEVVTVRKWESPSAVLDAVNLLVAVAS